MEYLWFAFAYSLNIAESTGLFVPLAHTVSIHILRHVTCLHVSTVMYCRMCSRNAFRKSQHVWLPK